MAVSFLGEQACGQRPPQMCWPDPRSPRGSFRQGGTRTASLGHPEQTAMRGLKTWLWPQRGEELTFTAFPTPRPPGP